MDKAARNAIETATQRARKLLEEDFAAQLEGDFDVRRDGIADQPGVHLSPRQVRQRDRIVEAVRHKRAAGMPELKDAVNDYQRDAAFTTLNRFVALKMLEARGLVLQCVSKGEESAGYREFCMLAPSLPTLPDSYRIYLESIFDELSTEVKVLFDRRDPAAVLWPRRTTVEQLLTIINDLELADVWLEDETIGWVYQYFNSVEERKGARRESQAPRNSRELAIRNQFFTPRYVVQFLTDNTLGRIWYEMQATQTALADRCEYLVRRPGTEFTPRAKKDPRDLRILDPACGSGHFLLYAFDLLATIYEEAYSGPDSPRSEATGTTLAEEYPDLESLRKALPGLILQYNLYGVDIDGRCVQIAQLALWLRAQRAYQDAGVDRAKRPPIRRSNVVVAEPLVADDETAKEFLEKLPEEEQRQAFQELIASLALAGDLGLLLRVEELRATPLQPGYAGDLFISAEERLYEALDRYAAEQATRAAAHRRLFADDTYAGLGLISTAAQEYDVVLMNPPFGDATAVGKTAISKLYPRSKNDIYAAFVERGIELLSPHGMLGAITSRTGFFLPTFQQWREEVLLDEAPPVIIADLGLGVMDAALVEAAAYCLEREGEQGGRTIVIRTLEERDKQSALRHTITAQSEISERYFDVDLEKFRSVPTSPFAYWVGDGVRELFTSLGAFESSERAARVGLQTSDDARFLRLWWEVPAANLGGRWVLFAKGGPFSPFYADVYLVVNWELAGRELSATKSAVVRNPAYYFRPGLTWPVRTKSELGFRVLPKGSAFGHKGPAVFVSGDNADELLAYLTVFRSAAYRGLLELQLAAADANRGGAARSYEVGVIQRTPVPSLDQDAVSTLAALGRRGWNLQRARDVANETSHAFVLPPGLMDGAAAPDSLAADLAVLQYDIDESLFSLYGLTDADRAALASTSDLQRVGAPVEIKGGDELRDDENDEGDDDDESPAVDSSVALRSWLLGVAFGRFDLRLATRDRAISPEPEPFHPLPAASPGMWPADEQPVPLRDILVDDPGHQYDIATMMADAADVAAVPVPEREELRRWLAREFFPLHVRMYSKSRRKAPIYWQLSTRSASYSVWVYLHALTRDTMFRVRNDYVAGKLRQEERRLDNLRAGAGDRATVSQRQAIDTQERCAEELRELATEVGRIAPLWNPNLDDGVLINFAPLWRLVPQHTSWQKELKTTWEALIVGRYDWAHLAMHLWPERVVPKCATDHSLAIAHGLDDVLWEEVRPGKSVARTTSTSKSKTLTARKNPARSKWVPRKTPTRTVDELIEERTNPEVKAALRDLLNAPAIVGTGRRGNGRARGGR